MTQFPKLLIIAVAVLGMPGRGHTETNEAHRQDLLQGLPKNYSVARSIRAAKNGYVPTNTLAFREWALSVMLAQANFINDRWQLGMPTPTTSDHATSFSALAKTGGEEGGITINNRFNLGFHNGRWTEFHDLRDSAETESLTKAGNSLTKKFAVEVAREALNRLGLSEAQLKLPRPPEVTQLDYESKDGKRWPLPLYKIEWKTRLKEQSGRVQMEVSGVTRKVVSYQNLIAPPIPIPTNYYQMLGISPRRNEWGRQFGYDPLDTDEFQRYARQAATDLANVLNKIWNLASGALTTNDLTSFLAVPNTNSADIKIAQFSERFYLQTAEGRLQLFKDMSHNVEWFMDDENRIKEAPGMTNLLNERAAEKLAREALQQLGLDEKQLQLREPPTVKQWSLTLDGRDDGPRYKLPLYDVMWLFPEKDYGKHGEGAAAIAFQISGTTKRVTMYANNSPLAPKLPLPPDYLRILGIVPVTNPAPVQPK